MYQYQVAPVGGLPLAIDFTASHHSMAVQRRRVVWGKGSSCSFGSRGGRATPWQRVHVLLRRHLCVRRRRSDRARRPRSGGGGIDANDCERRFSFEDQCVALGPAEERGAGEGAGARRSGRQPEHARPELPPWYESERRRQSDRPARPHSPRRGRRHRALHGLGSADRSDPLGILRRSVQRPRIHRLPPDL